MRILPADLPVSLAHLSEIETPPLELLDRASKAGFASIGIRMAPASPGGITYPLATAAEQAEIRRRMSDTGVSVLYMELLWLEDAPAPVEAWRRVIGSGAAIGATRIAVAGETADFAVAADRLASICDIAAEHGMDVDLEFMPYRSVATLGHAIDIVKRCGKANAHVLLDVLHFNRSNSSLADLDACPPGMIGTFQICDAPTTPPASVEGLIAEARTSRLLPGEGGLAIWPLIDRLPEGMPFGIEVPLALAHPELDATDRLTKLVTATRQFLAKGRSA